MILKVIQWLLKLTNKRWLIPYVRSIEWIGKPTGMMGSSALLDQALWVLFSGANNMLAVHTNRNWVWPLWIEEQWQPRSSAFIPTGAGLLGANLSRRNWTSLGHSDSPLECMVDPVGMITVEPHSWSLLPYLKSHGSLQAPPYLQDRVRQALTDDILPIVKTNFPIINDIEWSSTVAASYIENSLRIACQIEVVNHGLTAAVVVIGFGVRPYNVLSIGHINDLEKVGSFIRVNRTWDVEILDEPTRVVFGDRGTGDPMKESSSLAFNNETRAIKARSGIAAGSVEYDRTLQPGERVSLGVVIWCDENRKRKINFKREGRARIHTSVDSLIRAREEELRLNDLRAVRIKLPEERLEQQLDAIKLRLPAFDDVTHFSPGTFLYHTHWYRDAYFISEAFSNLGFLKEVRQKIESYPSRQQPSGAFVDHPGELDSHAIALCSMLTFAKKSGDPHLSKALFESVWKGLLWLNRQRVPATKKQAIHEGLLPASFSAEHFGGCDHYFWDNFWSMRAMSLGLQAARRMNRHKEAAILERMSLSFEESLQRAISSTLSRVGGQILPVSPYRWPDAACIGNLVACDPLELDTISGSWIKPTLNYLLDTHFYSGLFFQGVFHTGLNPYLTAQVARVLIRLDDPRAMDLIHAMSRAASPTVTWPEAINPRTLGGCMGDGDHGWAAAEFCNVLRQIVVQEDASGLTLFQGVPLQWLKPSSVTSIHNAPTLYGRITASLEADSSGVWARWNLEPWAGEEKTQVTLSLPIISTDKNSVVDPGHSNHRTRVRCSLRGERFFPNPMGAVV